MNNQWNSSYLTELLANSILLKLHFHSKRGRNKFAKIHNEKLIALLISVFTNYETPLFYKACENMHRNVINRWLVLIFNYYVHLRSTVCAKQMRLNKYCCELIPQLIAIFINVLILVKLYRIIIETTCSDFYHRNLRK